MPSPDFTNFSDASRDPFLNINKFEPLLKKQSAGFWQKQSEKRALNLFAAAANKVPAYKDFLKHHNIIAAKIKTAADFKLVPATDKQNYIQAYPLKARCWNGELKNFSLTASSSGTTGQPNYWPRGEIQTQQALLLHELIYKNFFGVHNKSTLLIIGFPMGVYVSGMATAVPSILLAKKYKMNVIPCGNNKLEVLKLIKNLSPHYQQTVLVSHPFFAKDVVETGEEEGVDWSKISLKTMLCSEGFSEAWREYLMHKAKIKHKAFGCISTYGSSELLLMATETPLSIKLKELTENSAGLNLEIFHRHHPPSIFQYNPLQVYIEDSNRELFFTSNSGIPLIRFNLHDSGVRLNFEDVIKKLKIQPAGHWQWPLVALWGRSDHTLKFYAANIYVDHLHAALNHRPFLHYITGKFSMRKFYNKQQDEFLEINIELKNRQRGGKALRKDLEEKIFDTLMQINMEYADAWSKAGKKAKPIVKLWPYNHPKYFKTGLKPKFIIADEK